jgi:hypothetical protein
MSTGYQLTTVGNYGTRGAGEYSRWNRRQGAFVAYTGLKSVVNGPNSPHLGVPTAFNFPPVEKPTVALLVSSCCLDDTAGCLEIFLQTRPAASFFLIQYPPIGLAEESIKSGMLVRMHKTLRTSAMPVQVDSAAVLRVSDDRG